MLKTIADISPEFSNLIDRLDLPFSKPQLRHIAQVAESLIVTEGRKTLSGLNRHIVGDPCPKAAAFSFRQSPWQAEILHAHLRTFLVQSALELAEKQQAEPVVYLSLDDSLTARHPGSTRLQAVDWHFDHSAAFSGGQPYTKAAVYVLLRMIVGEVSFTINIAPYLKASTVRRLNIERPVDDQLDFQTKLAIGMDMLAAARAIIPPGVKVYALFDSWYASAELLEHCRALDFHYICRLKSNRLLDGVQVRTHHQRSGHRRYTKVKVTAADGGSTDYLVRLYTGKLSKLPDNVRVFSSQRHSRDSYPRYFCTSDMSLSASQALNGYLKRWSCEVANWYIAERLGWADCRLWSVVSVNKYLVVLWLALAFLEYLQASEYPGLNLAEIIRVHRQAHAVRLLKQACQQVLKFRDIAGVLAAFTLAPIPT